jgi:hypothetical protein
MYYAHLNENGICIGISQLSGEVEAVNMVLIDSFDDDKIWRKHENGVWSTEKYVPEPEPTPPQPTLEEQVAQLREDNLILMDALATTFEEVLMLREEINAGGAE